jgi:hypothetical protein
MTVTDEWLVGNPTMNYLNMASSNHLNSTSAVEFDYTLESPLHLVSPVSDFSEYLTTPLFDSSTPMFDASVPMFDGPGVGMDAFFPLFTPPFVPLLDLPSPLPLSLPTATLFQLDPPPISHPVPLPIPAPRTRKSPPTGFRGSSTALLPLDAPVQSRTYVTPSTTSRKRKTVPVERALAKRQRDAPPTPSTASSSSFASPVMEEDELPADLVSAVERKRLQNTVSARRSRARKQEKLGELEGENKVLKRRVEELEARIRELEGR